MYLNVFAAHCSKMIRTVIMVRVCECGCVNARTKFETQRLTILTCETCQHAHCRYVKVRRSVEVWKCGSVEVWKCGSVDVWMCECVNV